MDHQKRYVCYHNVSFVSLLRNNQQLTFFYRLFDNAGMSGVTDEANSRGLYMAVNFTNMSVSLIQDFEPYDLAISESQGSVQLQPDGNFLVGCVLKYCSF